MFRGNPPDFGDSAYNLGADPAFLNIPHSASTLTVSWFANRAGFQGDADESWAMDNVSVSIAPEPRGDLQASIAVSSVDICWPGRTNRMYQVQYSSELTANAWVDLGAPVQGNGTNCVTDAIRGTERRFYRVVDPQ